MTERPGEGEAADESALVERARGGDHGAYAELVERHQEVVFRTAYLIVRDAGEAEDAAQEAFLRAHAALGRFRVGAPFRPWIVRIVANEARNRRRSAGRRIGPLPERRDEDRMLPDPIDPDPTPEQAVLRRERRDAVLRALDALSDDDRLVIAYRFFLGLSEAEMAEALDVAPGTVKSRLSRALARLRGRAAGALRDVAPGEGETVG